MDPSRNFRRHAATGRGSSGSHISDEYHIIAETTEGIVRLVRLSRLDFESIGVDVVGLGGGVASNA